MANYQVSVLYRGKKIVPAPFISWRAVPQRTSDGAQRSLVYQIQITGKLVAFMGSPDPSISGGDSNPLLNMFWATSGYPPDPPSALPETRVARLRDKMAAIRELFSDSGGWLEISPGDGSAPIRFQPRIGELSFADGPWFNDVSWSVQMEADHIFLGSTPWVFKQSDNLPEESWGLEPDEIGRTYKLTHTVSAQGRRRFADDGSVEAEGWQVAKDLVIGGPLAGTGAVSKLGFAQLFLTDAGVLGLDSFRPFNRLRHTQTDEPGGRYSVTETWLCYDPTASTPSGVSAGNAIEELNCETRYSLENGQYSVTVGGTVTGLEARDPGTDAITSTRWDNAQARFNGIDASVQLALAQSLSGKTLNPQVVSTTVARNKVSGVVSWQSSFDNRLGNSDPAYLSEIIEVEIGHAADVVAEIGVLNRPAGPVLQDVGSKTRKAATVSCNIVLATAYGVTPPASPSFNPLPSLLAAIGGAPAQLFVTSDSERYIPKRGSYSRTTSYVYQ